MSDSKIINVAKQKIREHEKAYCSELYQGVNVDEALCLNGHMGKVINDRTGGEVLSNSAEIGAEYGTVRKITAGET